MKKRAKIYIGVAAILTAGLIVGAKSRLLGCEVSSNGYAPVAQDIIAPSDAPSKGTVRKTGLLCPFVPEAKNR